MTPERVTIDATVALAYIHGWEEFHGRAAELFDLARRGEVELAAAASGFTFDAKGNLRAQVRDIFDRERVGETPQLAYPDIMFPGPNVYPGAGVEGFRDAWHAILGAGWNGPGTRPNRSDAMHVETHILLGRDVFVTDDVGLRTMCGLLGDYGFPVRAMALAKYLDSRRR